MATPLAPVAGTGTSGSSISISPCTAMPAHQAGDLLVAQFDCNSNPTVSTPASGWTVLRPALVSSTLLSQFLYYRVAVSSTEAIPAFTMSKTSVWTGNVTRFRGVDVVANLATPNSSTSGTSGTAIGWGTLAALDQPNCIHVFTMGQLAGTNGTLAPGTNYTELYEIENGTTIQSWMSYRNLVGPGTLTAANAAASASVRYVAQSFVLRSTEYATFRSGSAPAPTASVTSISIPKPAGAATGEVLVLDLHAESAVALSATMNGWTLKGGPYDQVSGANTSRTWLLYRYVQAGDGTSYTSPVLAASGNLTATVGCYYRGPASGDPFNGTPNFTGSTSTAAVTVAAVSPTFSNTTLLLLGGSWDWGLDWSALSSTLTSRLNPTGLNNGGGLLADEIRPATGTTGARAATPNTAGPSGLLLVPLLSSTSSSGGPQTFNVSVAGGLTPAAVLRKQTQKPLAGASTPTATLQSSLIVSRSFTAAESAAGALVRQAGKRLAGAQTSAGVLLRQAQKRVAGTQASAGTLVRQDQKALAGSATPAATLQPNLRAARVYAGTEAASGALARRANKTLVGSETPSGSVVKSVAHAIAGALSSAGALQTRKVVLLTFGGALGSAGSLARQVAKSLTGSLTSAGVVVRRATRTFVGSLTSSGLLVRRAGRALAGSLTPAAALTLRTSKSLAGALTGAGALSLQKLANIFPVALAGTLTSSGTLIRQTSRSLAGSLPTAGSVRRSVLRLLGATLASAGGLVRRVNKVWASSLPSSGALTLTQVRLKSLTGALGSAGVLLRQARKASAGTLATSSSLLRGARLVRQGTLAPLGVYVARVTRSFSGTSAASGTLATSRRLLLATQGAVAAAGSVARRAGISASGALSSAGTQLLRVQLQLVGVLGTTGSVARAASTALAGTVAPAGELQNAVMRVVNVAGELASSGSTTLARLVGVTLGGLLQPIGAATVVLARTWLPTVVVRARARVLAASVGTRTLAASVPARISRFLAPKPPS